MVAYLLYMIRYWQKYCMFLHWKNPILHRSFHMQVFQKCCIQFLNQKICAVTCLSQLTFNFNDHIWSMTVYNSLTVTYEMQPFSHCHTHANRSETIWWFYLKIQKLSLIFNCNRVKLSLISNCNRVNHHILSITQKNCPWPRTLLIFFCLNHINIPV